METNFVAYNTAVKASELQNTDAKSISNQVKHIVMDVDNKFGSDVFSERIAMPVWKRANDLNGIQATFEKSGLTIEQFAFQSLILEIDNVLTSAADKAVLSVQLNPIKEMLKNNLEPNYNNLAKEHPVAIQEIATNNTRKVLPPTYKTTKKVVVFAVSCILAIAVACTATFFITKELVSKDSYKNGYDSGYDVAKLDANQQYEKGREDGYTEGREVGYDLGYLDGGKEGERKANEKAKEAVVSRQTVTLTPGNYKVGTDIAAGRYKLVAMNGSGSVISIGSLLSTRLAVNSDYTQKEYTATLKSDSELVINDVTIKFVPV